MENYIGLLIVMIIIGVVILDVIFNIWHRWP